jgi:hypothetical protein
MLLGEPGHEVHRHANRIGDRLVLVVNELGKEVDQILDADLTRDDG